MTVASKNFETLLKRFPNIPAVLNGYANLLISGKQYDLAAKHLKQAIRIDANFCDGYVNLARLQTLQNKNNLSIKTYSTASKLRPNDINIQIGLAVAYKGDGQTKCAEDIYQKLLTTANGQSNLRVLVNFAAILRERQSYQDAIKVLRQALSYHPNSALVHSVLAANLALNKDMVDAEHHYQIAIQLEPNNVEIQIEYAHFRWAQDIDQPFAPIIQAINEPISQYSLYIACIDLLLNAEQLDLAADILKLGREVLKSDPSYNMFAARHARMTGDLEQALIYINLALKQSKRPVSVSIENERGYVALARKDAKLALTIYRNLQRREPNNQGWWTLYSTALKLAEMNAEYATLCDYSLVHCVSVIDDKGTNFIQSLTNKLEEVHANTNHPIGQSLRNGTQTYEDIFDDKATVIQELKTWIQGQAKEFIQCVNGRKNHPFLCKVGKPLSFSGSWSVCLRTGGYHTSHFHPQGWLSGVFYIDVPEAVNKDGQGWLRFGVPEIGQLDLIADYAIKPANGTLVLFPSFMWHGTQPFEDGDRRMTIAFDMIPSDS